MIHVIGRERGIRERRVRPLLLCGAILASCAMNVGDDEPVHGPDRIGSVSSAVSTTDYTDSSGQVKVRVKTCDWTTSQRVNEAYCTVDSGWVMVGGGAEIQGQGDPGALLKASFPSPNSFPEGGVNTTWVARSSDHVQEFSHKLRAYVIGLKLGTMSASTLASNRSTGDNTTVLGTSVSIDKAVPSSDYTLIGGGAEVLPSTSPIFLTESRPFGTSWRSSAKNNQGSGTGAIKSYAIGIKTCPTGSGWSGCLSFNVPWSSPGPFSDYGTASYSVTGNGQGRVQTAVGGLAQTDGGAGRYLHDLIPFPHSGNDNGFTVRTKNHGGDDTAFMNGMAITVKKQ